MLQIFKKTAGYSERVMETETIQKNEASLKSQRVRTTIIAYYKCINI
jgi:hypothetical protein